MVTDIKNAFAGKKVCILRSNPVRPDSRVEKEAWTLKKAGFDVHILAWDRDTDVSESENYVNVADVKIPITRLGHKATFGEGMKNIRAYLAFQFHMRKWLKSHSFDVVHACDFDTAFFSRGIVKRKKEKFVFDIFDFLCGDAKNLMQHMVKKAQISIINSSDATIICTEERKKQIQGSTPKRLAVIHNTPSASQIKGGDLTVAPSDRVKIVYVGILQDYRLLKEITEVVSESKDVELHVGGFGKFDSYFLEMSQANENIHFYGRLSYDQALNLEQQCDIMLAVYDPSIENHVFAAPNKFYESLMIGKPVVMVRGTGMSQIVEENDIGVLIEYSKEGFKQGLEKLMSKRDEWDTIGEHMKKIYSESYQWETMEKRLIELYSQLVQ